MQTLREYKCPCCGGAIAFDSSSQKMKCPYCDTQFDVETLEQYAAETQNTVQDDMHWESEAGSEWSQNEAENVCSYVCNSCGGEIICDVTTAATQCPFCGNPVIMNGNVSGELKPDIVIPFKLDKKAAKQALMKHMSGKRLLPKVFKDENHIDEIKGVYVPFWLFEADVDARIQYSAKKVRHWSDKNYNYTETRHYSLLRGGNIGFANVPVDGSSKMADELMESIEPFDVSEAVDFNSAFLAGYMADKYDVGVDQSITRANDRIRKSTVDAFADTVNGYLSVEVKDSSLQFHNGKSKYALYPVWILNTTWKDKKYTFAMNGQTGKIVGDLPVDGKAAAKWTLGLTAGVGIAAYGVMYLLQILGII